MVSAGAHVTDAVAVVAVAVVVVVELLRDDS